MKSCFIVPRVFFCLWSKEIKRQRQRKIHRKYFKVQKPSIERYIPYNSAFFFFFYKVHVYILIQLKEWTEKLQGLIKEKFSFLAFFFLYCKIWDYFLQLAYVACIHGINLYRCISLTRNIRVVMNLTLSNSMQLWVMLCRATQDRRAMVESSDRMWSTGEGNGKPL